MIVQPRQAVNAYNRKVTAQNRANLQAVNDYNRKVTAQNRLTTSVNGQGITYRPQEEVLAERVHQAIDFDDGRAYDVFLSYARSDGQALAGLLREALEDEGVSVWARHRGDAARQEHVAADGRWAAEGARAGIALLTPAYISGRFWTQRELGVLLSKPTLIPVLQGVTFEAVREFSGTGFPPLP